MFMAPGLDQCLFRRASYRTLLPNAISVLFSEGAGNIQAQIFGKNSVNSGGMRLSPVGYRGVREIGVQSAV